MQNRVDLQISGRHPAVWLLALWVARSGQRVRVCLVGKEPSGIWRVARAPFEWFGEEPPLWPVNWSRAHFSGLAWYASEAGAELFPWQMTELSLQSCLYEMRQDAEFWGVEIVQTAPDPALPGLDLRLTLNPVLGFWIWSSSEPLSAPGVLEIMPQLDALMLWTHSCGSSALALPGQADQCPELPEWVVERSDLFSETVFQAECSDWPILHAGAAQLVMALPAGALAPRAAVQQALVLLWVRYAGEQLARYGCTNPQVWERICAYWGKLIIGTEDKLQKYKFLR